MSNVVTDKVLQSTAVLEQVLLLPRTQLGSQHPPQAAPNHLPFQLQGQQSALMYTHTLHNTCTTFQQKWLAGSLCSVWVGRGARPESPLSTARAHDEEENQLPKALLTPQTNMTFKGLGG